LYPLELTIDIPSKNLGNVRSNRPKIPRTTRRAGERVSHGEGLLAIGGHLWRPSRTAHDRIPLSATMLIDNARAPSGVAPRLPGRRYGTHSMRRTKAAQIYKKTGNLRAVQLLLGHSKLESTVRYLGIEVDDALSISEQVEL
jgi:integrase